MIEKGNPQKWYETAGVSMDVMKNQMPHLFVGFNGDVVVRHAQNGSILITAFEDKSNRTASYIYRFNPQTQTAQLVYFNSKRNMVGQSIDSLMDQVNFNKYLSTEDGFATLSPLMGIEPQYVKDRFPEAQECNQILINRSFDERSPKLRITFGVKDVAPIEYIYDYSIDTDNNELVYTSKDKWLNRGSKEAKN